MNIVIMRDEEGRVIEAWTDSDAEVTLHFADLDLTESQPGTLKMLSASADDELLVDHWTMSVHNEPQLVAQLALPPARLWARASIPPERRPLPYPLPLEAPLAPQQGMCQFCGAPAATVTGGITTCDACDGPPQQGA